MASKRRNCYSTEELSTKSLPPSQPMVLPGNTLKVMNQSSVLNQSSVQNQIQKFFENNNNPISLVSLANLVVKDEEGMRISVFNYAQKSAQGRQKLKKFLQSIPGICFHDEQVDARISLKPASSESNLSLNTPISTFLQYDKLLLKKSLSREYLEYFSPRNEKLKSELKSKNIVGSNFSIGNRRSAQNSDLYSIKSGSVRPDAHWFLPAKLVEFQR